MNSRTLFVISCLLSLLVPAAEARATELHFFAENSKGREFAAQSPDTPINPASVIKVATSMMALERLGPDHRYATTLSCSGPCTVEGGLLSGDLILEGGGDPDFQAENAWLFSRALEEMGVTELSGDLRINGLFWMGWEHGIRKREVVPARRNRLMGGRLLKAWDSCRWSHVEESSWEEAAPRHGWDPADRPSLKIRGRIISDEKDVEGTIPLFRHLSNPLSVILKRFNTFSNNDIIRIAEPLGGAHALEAFLRVLLAGTRGEIRISAASGEGLNRLTPRQIVHLLRAFEAMCEKHNLSLSDLLPLPGCDPGPTPRMFPRLASGPGARTAVIKTGTLSTTDGGVAVLSGFFELASTRERIAFCVAAPRAGGALRQWRKKEESWLLALEKKLGGARAFSCGAALPFSDSLARVEKMIPQLRVRAKITSCLARPDVLQIWIGRLRESGGVALPTLSISRLSPSRRCGADGMRKAAVIFSRALSMKEPQHER